MVPAIQTGRMADLGIEHLSTCSYRDTDQIAGSFARDRQSFAEVCTILASLHPDTEPGPSWRAAYWKWNVSLRLLPMWWSWWEASGCTCPTTRMYRMHSKVRLVTARLTPHNSRGCFHSRCRYWQWLVMDSISPSPWGLKLDSHVSVFMEEYTGITIHGQCLHHASRTYR